MISPSHAQSLHGPIHHRPVRRLRSLAVPGAQREAAALGLHLRHAGPARLVLLHMEGDQCGAFIVSVIYLGAWMRGVWSHWIAPTFEAAPGPVMGNQEELLAQNSFTPQTCTWAAPCVACPTIQMPRRAAAHRDTRCLCLLDTSRQECLVCERTQHRNLNVRNTDLHVISAAGW